jgi:hypothetical protein
MYGKAFAPEYQGALTALSVNASLAAELADPARTPARTGLRHAGEMVARAEQELGVPAEAAR